jgi:hypothetical protein
LSSQQLRQMLLNHPNSRIREKAQEAQRVNQQPRSGLDSQDWFASLSSLWGFLNPWMVTDAQAQVGGVIKKLPPKYAFTLTPQQIYVPPANTIDLLGASAFNGCYAHWCYYLGNGSNGSVGEPPALGFSVAKPLVHLHAWLPNNGWYMIDFYGTGKPKTTLRHGNPFTVLESWDMGTSPTYSNHFATVEYLAQGLHDFYFSVDQAHLWFEEVAVEEF